MRQDMLLTDYERFLELGRLAREDPRLTHDWGDPACDGLPIVRDLRAAGVHVAPILTDRLLHARDEQEYLAIVYGIQMSRSVALARLLLPECEGPDPERRAYALQALYLVDAHAFRRRFFASLSDPAPVVRWMALIALRFASLRRRFRKWEQERIAAMARDPDEEGDVRSVALEALAARGGIRYGQLLQELIERDPSPEMRDLAMRCWTEEQAMRRQRRRGPPPRGVEP